MNTEVKRIGDLEIQQDLDYQRIEWRCERVGWVLMLLTLLAAALGLFGGGVLSGATATNADQTIRVEYERFLHIHSESSIKIDLAASLTDQGEVRLHLNREFCDAVQQLRATPVLHWEAGADGQVLVVRVADRGQPLRIYLYFDPDRIGTVVGRIGTSEGDPVQFQQFSYP